MNFDMNEAIQVLKSTPGTLTSLLAGLSDNWLHTNEGEETWTPIQVIGHLIEGEKYNWIPRLELIIQQGAAVSFPPFDRYAHLTKESESSLDNKLSEFQKLRMQNLNRLQALVHTEEQLELKGNHPQFGTVKIRELLSTWVVHDLTHMSQILRIMAKRYNQDVGPWIEFLRILK
ncbi:DinB family protein [Paenibacillus woosongensis]|uniref:DinB-like domain-containing protein n=1 Tax=Paenibacillus woosongensis TaxID=307580 RepID=A0ABQ4MVC1_9BACL|nr:DinB family protein [Paenibacillus woosongensis]GIP59878.1 hypothetical protein J15TS10_36920 [Paenibacillus woosongensis]